VALNPATLQASLLSIFNSAKGSQMSEADFAAYMSNAIDTYIKTATVMVTIPGALGGGSGLPGTGTLS
jgi:hypothetical protein